MDKHGYVHCTFKIRKKNKSPKITENEKYHIAKFAELSGSKRIYIEYDGNIPDEDNLTIINDKKQKTLTVE